MDEFAYYYALKTEARARVMRAINKKILNFGSIVDWDRTTFSSVNTEAIEYAEHEWPKYYCGKTHEGFEVSWRKIFSDTIKQPSYFDMAIWQNVNGVDILQGMAVGNTSSGKKHVTIKWVERNFGPEYTRFGILLPLLSCAEEYAKLLNSERVLIKNPIDPSVYEKYGYKLFRVPKSEARFLAKEIS